MIVQSLRSWVSREKNAGYFVGWHLWWPLGLASACAEKRPLLCTPLRSHSRHGSVEIPICTPDGVFVFTISMQTGIGCSNLHVTAKESQSLIARLSTGNWTRTRPVMLRMLRHVDVYDAVRKWT